MENNINKTLPSFEDIPKPQMVAIVHASGSGSKVFQAFIDGHEEVYMVPAYPLMYFYPHWQTWEKSLVNNWTWQNILNVFCEKHASVLDSRKIPGFNGMTNLGDNRNEYISIDENRFKQIVLYLLKKQTITSRNFLLAIHFAYAYCRDEDISKKKILVYHIHSSEYLVELLFKDFPDVLTVGMIRDPRSNLERRYKGSLRNVDDGKLNVSDALINRKRPYFQACEHGFNGLNLLNGLPLTNTKVIKHEDLILNLEKVMRTSAAFLGITYNSNLENISFGKKIWWGAAVYDMKPTNKVNSTILSKDWKNSIGKTDWFVREGVLYDFFKKYSYELLKYKNDNWINRAILLIAIALPSKIERSVFWEYCNPKNHIEFLKACIAEATNKVPLKDYTWNATYLYKWTYKDLKLWRKRWYVNVLELGNSKSSHIIRFSGQLIYVSSNYFRFLFSLITYPGIIVKRCLLQYQYFFRRLKSDNILPDEIINTYKTY